MEKQQNTELSQYCVSHYNAASTEKSLFLTLPADFVTEARALGAITTKTVSGFFDLTPFVMQPEELTDIKNLSRQPLIIELLKDIRLMSLRKDILLQVNAQYSILAQITPPKLFAWLVRRPGEVHAALNALTQGLAEYIIQALSAGVKIVSLADPQAQLGILGELRYKEFVANYQIELLNIISRANSRGIVHLCPYSFVTLEQQGRLTVNSEPTKYLSYERSLLDIANASNKIVFVGHQCPHTKNAEYLYRLEIAACLPF